MNCLLLMVSIEKARKPLHGNAPIPGWPVTITCNWCSSSTFADVLGSTKSSLLRCSQRILSLSSFIWRNVTYAGRIRSWEVLHGSRDWITPTASCSGFATSGAAWSFSTLSAVRHARSKTIWLDGASPSSSGWRRSARAVEGTTQSLIITGVVYSDPGEGQRSPWRSWYWRKVSSIARGLHAKILYVWQWEETCGGIVNGEASWTGRNRGRGGWGIVGSS